MTTLRTIIVLLSIAVIAATAMESRAVPLQIVNPGFDAAVTGTNFVYEGFFYGPGDPMPDHTYGLENITGNGDNITGLGDAASGATIPNAAVEIFGYTGTAGSGILHDTRDFLTGHGPDGSAAYIGFGGGDGSPKSFSQTLSSATWQPNTKYTFTVEVSDRRFGPTDNVSFPSGGSTAPLGIRLALSGSTEPTGVLTFTKPSPGATSLASYVVTTGAAGTHPTGNVTITIHAQGYAGLAASQVAFDNLTLDASPAPIADADFDGDDDVDGADLLIWQRGVGIAATQPAGDADGSGAVNGADLAIWKSEYGTPQSVASAMAIPEPQSVVLWGLGGAALAVTTRRRRAFTPAALLLPFAVIALAAGCGDSGPDRATVAGAVTLDGQPVESGSIAFLPAEGTQGPSAGGVISAGRYRIDSAKGVVVGTNRVEINVPRKTGRMIPSPIGSGMIEEYFEGVSPELNADALAAREIKSGENEIDFDLVSAP